MKSLFAFLLGVLPLLVSAQASDYRTPQVGEGLKSKVLIVPFNSATSYFSDCDKALAGESKLRPLQVRENFRNGLDQAIHNMLGDQYTTIDLQEVNGGDQGPNHKRFYRNVKYSYEMPTRLADAPETGRWIVRVKDRISRIKIGQRGKSEGAQPVGDDEVEAYSWVSNHEDKYMAANWPENSYLNDLVEEHSPDYIITINQFEIKTDYRKCVDRELGNFTRRIRVHFNVFNASGVCIFGDVVTATYNSTTEEIENIVADNFRLLGEFISSPLGMPLSAK